MHHYKYKTSTSIFSRAFRFFQPRCHFVAMDNRRHVWFLSKTKVCWDRLAKNLYFRASCRFFFSRDAKTKLLKRDLLDHYHSLVSLQLLGLAGNEIY